jgi:hypothetical protein
MHHFTFLNSSGYAFITMMSEEEANRVIREAHIEIGNSHIQFQNLISL